MKLARLQTLFFATLPIALLVGCGGGGGGGGAGSGPSGQLQLVVDWPARGRSVPTYANSLKGTLTIPGGGSATLTINRTGDGASTGQSTFSSAIPVGTHSLKVDAYSSTNAQGSIVASATVSVVINEGQITVENISADLASTIDHVQIDTSPLSVQSGLTLQLAASARTAVGAVILVPAGSFSWTLVSGGGFGSVSSSGLFSGSAVGTSRVRVTEAESAKFAEADISVTAPPPPPVVYNFAFVSTRDDVGGFGNTAIYTMNTDGTSVARLTTEDFVFYQPEWSPNASQLVFASDRIGPTSDVFKMNANGSSITLVAGDIGEFETDPCFNPSGTKVAFSKTVSGRWQIFTVNPDGSGLLLITDTGGNDFRPQYSPDGTKIAFESDADGDLDVYTCNANGTGLTKITNNTVDDFAPSWSPDGTKLVFISDSPGRTEIYTVPAAGGTPTRITNLTGDKDEPVFTLDGAKILFARDPGSGFYDIFMVNANGSSPQNLTNTPDSDDYSPAVKP